MTAPPATRVSPGSEADLPTVRVESRWERALRTARGGIGLAVLLLAGCAMPVPPEAAREGTEAGPGGRRQPLALSPRQELAVGRRAYQEVKEQFRDRLLPEG